MKLSKVVVVGQGYVGLPIAMRAVEFGHTVVGIDLDERRVRGLERGQSYVEDISDLTLSAAVQRVGTARQSATTTLKLSTWQ